MRKGNLTDDDLRLLDEYRRSFAGAYDVVASAIRNELGLEPTGRPAKSTTSITEKLQRESIRLTQMQDIAGCRIIVPELAEQDRVAAALTKLFVQSTVVDRRQKPSHGYRAVHLVVVIDRRGVEIQVRTALQQLWAESSEKLADLLDSAIKYGGGDPAIQAALVDLSNAIATFEGHEYSVLEAQRKFNNLLSKAALTEDEHAAIIAGQKTAISLQAKMRAAREEILEAFRQAVKKLQE